MSILDQLITDRTAEDVAQETAKGFYTASDMNRVEMAVEYLAGLLQELPRILIEYGAALGINWAQNRLGYNPDFLNLQTHTNWSIWDIPAEADAQRYLSNVSAICTAMKVDLTDVPFTLNWLTYKGANGIEDGLKRAWGACKTLEQSEKKRMDCTAQAWCMSGEIFAGEVM